MCFMFLAEKPVTLVLNIQIAILLGELTLNEGRPGYPTSERAHMQHGYSKEEGTDPSLHPSVSRG